MNRHLQRVREEHFSSQTYQKQKNKKTFQIVVLCVIIFLGVSYLVSTKPDSKNSSQPASKPEQNQSLPYEQVDVKNLWNLVLVNAENPLSKEFTVQLCEVEGEPVDVRIEKALKQMMSASKKDGAELVICSAYRSVSTQERLYDNSVQTYRSQGYDETQSMQKAGFYTQPPGASEHHTGLAIDFVTDSSWELSEQFAETKQYRWLAEHAAEYGFVERYPKEKEAITQIGWEPWHYRFVGIDTAQAMKESGLCLEEYLETIAKNNGN